MSPEIFSMEMLENYQKNRKVSIFTHASYKQISLKEFYTTSPEKFSMKIVENYI